MKRISKSMPYKELIHEHEGLVRTLARAISTGKMSGIKKLHKNQLGELREYKEEYKQKRRK